MMQSDIEQFEDYIRKTFLRQGLPTERCSNILFSQLAHMPSYRGINFPFQFVEREIKHLEGLGDSGTKPAAPFSEKGRLRGFMHKHFYVPGYEHLGVNAKRAWKFDKANSGKLSQMAQPIAQRYARSEQTEADAWQFAGELARELLIALMDC